MQPAQFFSVGITSAALHLNWLKLFPLLILAGGVVTCYYSLHDILSLFLNAIIPDSGILYLENAFT